MNAVLNEAGVSSEESEDSNKDDVKLPYKKDIRFDETRSNAFARKTDCGVRAKTVDEGGKSCSENKRRYYKESDYSQSYMVSDALPSESVTRKADCRLENKTDHEDRKSCTEYPKTKKIFYEETKFDSGTSKSSARREDYKDRDKTDDQDEKSYTEYTRTKRSYEETEPHSGTSKIKILRTQEEAGSNHGSIVAAHYSTAEHGLGARNESRIVYLRNFNNWIKGMLISEYLKELQCSGNRIHALDMCCGKGGDLLKWRIGGIKHLVCSDIAELAVENCKKRYDDMMTRKRDGNKLFSAEFIVCDLTKTRIRGKYEDPSMHFDIVSCQFAFHYSFESLPQAECMLRNAAECLKPGGYFIGTIPDANAIVHRYKQFKKRCFGNSVYSITFDDSLSDDNYPLFGAKYNFNLDGVVDCPEFLVHFPTLVKLAEKYNLVLLKKRRFPDFFKEKMNNGIHLLRRMSAMEQYPPPHRGGRLVGSETNDYNHAKEYLAENRDYRSVKTLSLPEWEVASLYLLFVFQKKISSDK